MKCNDIHYDNIDDCDVCWRFRSQNINFAQGASSFGFSSCCAFRLGGIQINKKN